MLSAEAAGLPSCKRKKRLPAAAVMYTMMGCCKAAGVNVYDWLVYFLDHVHEYDYAPELDLAELLPGNLLAKGLVGAIGESPTRL